MIVSLNFTYPLPPALKGRGNPFYSFFAAGTGSKKAVKKLPSPREGAGVRGVFVDLKNLPLKDGGGLQVS